MKHSFYKTIKGRFLLIVCSLIIVLSIGIITFTYVTFYNRLENNVIHSTDSSLSLLANDINKKLSDIYSYAQWCQNNNTDIINYIKTSPSSPSYGRITTRAKERMDEEHLRNPAHTYMQRVIIANSEREDFLQYTSSYYSISRPMVKLITEFSYYETAMSESSCTLNCGLQKSPLGRTPTDCFPVIQPIKNLYSIHDIGFVYIEISPRLLSDTVLEYTTLADSLPLYFTIGDATYLIKENQLEKLSDHYELLKKNRKKLSNNGHQYLEIHKKGKTQRLVTIPLETEHCYITQTIPDELFHQQLQSYLFLIVTILFLLLLLGTFLYFLLARLVNNPVTALNNRLTCIAKGDFTKDAAIEWENELGDIGRSINKLSADIQDLMNKRIEDEKEKKDYEYKMLQSQINPHFLYNTLNSIKWMAITQNAPGISEMVTALSRLLKNIAKGSKTIVTIQDEFSFLDDYFLIQKYRYGGAIRLEYKIDDKELLANKILRFTLQPIVENAIFHGIEPKGCEGIITIHLYSDDKTKIKIDITDNGIGMTPELIQKILSEDEPDKSQFFRDVGISSVHKRLQYTFGSTCGLFIHSVPGKSTTMTVTLKNTLEEGTLECTSY